jgi:Xaa-Pro aminopeptidase
MGMSAFSREKRAEFDLNVLRERRKRLLGRMKGRPFLLPAGESKPRNYPANPYPYRASSHFLWAVGWPVPGAVFGSDGRAGFLFLRERGESDELWHGQMPTLPEYAEFLGLEVKPLSDLSDWVRSQGPERIQFLPASDTRSTQFILSLLGREVSEKSAFLWEEKDLQLARAMIEMRLCHDPLLIGSMRKACEVTRRAFFAGMSVTRPGVEERQIYGKMLGEIAAAGMQAAYSPIVTVRGEILHCESYEHTTKAGDLILADVGAESLGGVASDVTRTWPASGRFSATQKLLYEVVLRAQQCAIDALVPGQRYREVHLAACRSLLADLVAIGILRGDPAELLSDGIHAILFPHGIGHLLGLDVHDMEDLGDLAGYEDGRLRSSQFGLNHLRMDRDLRPGMVVTIEPGFYQIAGILRPESPLSKKAGDRLNRKELARFSDVRGIRIEDDLLITDKGSECLTREIPKAPAEIEKFLAG